MKHSHQSNVRKICIEVEFNRFSDCRALRDPIPRDAFSFTALPVSGRRLEISEEVSSAGIEQNTPDFCGRRIQMPAQRESLMCVAESYVVQQAKDFDERLRCQLAPNISIVLVVRIQYDHGVREEHAEIVEFATDLFSFCAVLDKGLCQAQIGRAH